MTDAERIPTLIKIGSTVDTLDDAERTAAQELLAFDGQKYPSDGCAITASSLLRMAGIDVPFTFLALGLDELMQKRGWATIAVGDQKPGDLGSTCFGGVRHPGTDHIFLVVGDLNPQEMIVADNQRTYPHQRRTDGKDGKTPADHFLRAPAG